ncbi:hypothetical protein [Spiroplasma endosymbiont of Labia minor]|uniref:hypothetical protein n=1 Tax=Spiroplasma endosymbiont of Labia minor TaxID=3066305 RepID=UPI0030D3F0B5
MTKKNQRLNYLNEVIFKRDLDGRINTDLYYVHKRLPECNHLIIYFDYSILKYQCTNCGMLFANMKKRDLKKMISRIVF